MNLRLFVAVACGLPVRFSIADTNTGQFHLNFNCNAVKTMSWPCLLALALLRVSQQRAASRNRRLFLRSVGCFADSE
jgi:hypothetical protein